MGTSSVRLVILCNADMDLSLTRTDANRNAAVESSVVASRSHRRIDRYAHVRRLQMTVSRPERFASESHRANKLFFQILQQGLNEYTDRNESDRESTKAGKEFELSNTVQELSLFVDLCH